MRTLEVDASQLLSRTSRRGVLHFNSNYVESSVREEDILFVVLNCLCSIHF